MDEESPASANLCPELAKAAADPAGTAVLLTSLVKASLSQDWRREHSHGVVLDRLAGLIELHLARLGDELPDLGCGDDLSERGNEAACVACLKLARNLCAGSPHVQEHWWGRGLIQKLAARLREDLAAPGGSRSTGWCEAVPSFITNIVAGNGKLREAVLAELFPHHLGAFCALCWKRPELAFMLAQNLFANTVEGQVAPTQKLVETEDGHCLLFLLLSFLRGRQDESENNLTAKALEWATVFFHGLWLAGGFPSACRGIKQLTVRRLHDFLGGMAGVHDAGSSDEAGGTFPVSVGFWRLSESLCGHMEARCLLWHTIHGLLAGPGEMGHNSSGSASVELARVLLGSAAFAELAAEEMAQCLAVLARVWGLDWRPLPVPPEASSVLGVDAAALDALALVDGTGEAPLLVADTGHGEVAGASHLAADSGPGNDSSGVPCPEAHGGAGRGKFAEGPPLAAGDAPADADEIPVLAADNRPGLVAEDTVLPVDGRAGNDADPSSLDSRPSSIVGATALAEPQEYQPDERECPGSQRLFQELLAAAVELAAVPSVTFPARLTGLYLISCIAFIDALHRLRFGEQLQKRTYSAGAAEASRACLLVEQLRLCANILYENPPAQDFIRLTGGLRVLLSHCHADHELPLLREAGIFAVRNATHLHAVNQAAVKELLVQQRAAADAGQELVEDLELS